MAARIIMPKAGMAMEEGTIVKWLKQEGEAVAMGEPLLEIHTDKVNMEVEASTDGILLKILGQEGDVFPVTHTIGYIGQLGDRIEDNMEVQNQTIETPVREGSPQLLSKELGQNKEFKSVSGKIPATPLARTVANEKGIDLRTIQGTGKYGEIRSRDIPLIQGAAMTPLVKRIVEKNNIDVEKIQGSGYKGKIRKEDLFIKEQNVPEIEMSPVEELAGPETFDKKPLTGMRKIIAQRMMASHLQVPAVTLNAKADVTALAQLKDQLVTQISLKVTFSDFVIKAVAKTLKEYSNINVCLQGEEILFRKEIHIGMAVALEDGLIVPVIQDVDKLTIREVSEKTKEMARKGREGKLLPSEIENGSLTVSNLGMYDVLSFTPIINQPESAILGLCAIQEELKMIDGIIESRKTMGLSLTIDHRLIDGAQGAIFLKRLKTLLENPLEILV